jgi:tetratricopeptide (TPR) repeat protein
MAAAAPANASPAAALIAEAQELLESFDAEGAAARLQEVLRHEPENVAALDLLAQCFAELGRSEEAVRAYQASARLAPDENPSKFLSMGQLQSGHVALQSLRHGLKLLAAERQRLVARGEDTAAVDLMVSNGFAAVADLFVTDLCDEPNAEAECERAVKLAREAAPEGVDAVYAFINLRLIQNRRDEARRAAAHIAPQITEESEVGYETKANVAKACYELELFEEASRLFDLVLAEDDSASDLWYMAALAHHKAGAFELAREYAEKLQELLRKEPDAEVADALAELVEANERALAQSDARRGAAPRARRKPASRGGSAMNDEEDEEEEDDDEEEEEDDDDDGDAEERRDDDDNE